MPSPKASQIIPSYIRFTLTNIESLFAALGALTILIDPAKYTSSLTRHTISSTAIGPQFLYTQMAGGWLYIAFSEAVILRFVDDYRVWRIAQAVGGWAEWLKVGAWTVEDWGVTVTTWPFLLMRVAIVLGVGMRKVKQQ